VCKQGVSTSTTKQDLMKMNFNKKKPVAALRSIVRGKESSSGCSGAAGEKPMLPGRRRVSKPGFVIDMCHSSALDAHFVAGSPEGNTAVRPGATSACRQALNKVGGKAADRGKKVKVGSQVSIKATALCSRSEAGMPVQATIEGDGSVIRLA
jgi:hypothetical protein